MVQMNFVANANPDPMLGGSAKPVASVRISFLPAGSNRKRK